MGAQTASDLRRLGRVQEQRPVLEDDHRQVEDAGGGQRDAGLDSLNPDPLIIN